jgi:hypothetical protein
MIAAKVTQQTTVHISLVFAHHGDKEAYCPWDSSTMASVCLVRVSHGQYVEGLHIMLPCKYKTDTLCEFLMDLPPVEAVYEATLLPPPILGNCSITSSSVQVSVQFVRDSQEDTSSHLQDCSPLLTSMQVSLDLTPPSITSTHITEHVTAINASFTMHLVFSEPIKWRAWPGSTTAIIIPANSSDFFSATNIHSALLSVLTPANDSDGYALQYQITIWSWPGAFVDVQIEARSYLDMAGHHGLNTSTVQIAMPTLSVWNRMAATSTALTSATLSIATVSSSVAATAASTVGSNVNVLRSFGHTQFLAMSISMAVPALPQQYVALCEGLQWLNLLSPNRDISHQAVVRVEHGQVGARSPAEFTMGDLRISVLLLFGVLAAVTLLQLAAWALFFCRKAVLPR